MIEQMYEPESKYDGRWWSDPQYIKWFKFREMPAIPVWIRELEMYRRGYMPEQEEQEYEVEVTDREDSYTRSERKENRTWLPAGEYEIDCGAGQSVIQMKDGKYWVRLDQGGYLAPGSGEEWETGRQTQRGGTITPAGSRKDRVDTRCRGWM